MKLTFMGATGTVTGSKYLLEDGGKKFLVDCGLFQGLKKLRLRNWERFPVDPHRIDAVVLTHAHMDHSGYLPLLVRDGFKGPIYCSHATKDLCAILLPDGGRIQERDAERANRRGYTKHRPAVGLYTEKDALNALRQFKPVPFEEEHALGKSLTFRMSRAGHILGAACVKISNGEKSIVFSGDLGRPNDPIMKAPAQFEEADYLILESTYGDRLHEAIDPLETLAEVINRTFKRGGRVLIPAFAVGRAQLILYYLNELIRQQRIQKAPVFLDSPMAMDVTREWQEHADQHRLDAKTCERVCRTATYIQNVDESKALNEIQGPAIIISASGMATGGRVLHHLIHHIRHPRNTILFSGYQAAGTRGARLVHGEKEIKIHGRLYQVAAEIENLTSLSAHADYREILAWLGSFRRPPQKTFLTHGEPEASSSLKFKIEEYLGWDAVVPDDMEVVHLWP